MKLLDKKGFILVETLIVTVFVATLFLLVYQNIVPYIGEYETLTTYDDVDSVYASNLYKQLLVRAMDTDYVDTHLLTNTYLDITDCTNSNIYQNVSYCQKLKQMIGVSENDTILLTAYDISKFREEVKTNEFFDSGKLSNFRSYVNTISNKDSFYDETNPNQFLIGKYRLFLTRTVVNADKSTSLRYVNLGIYDGKYKRYTMGEKVEFNPGNGIQTFYVLKNSSSYEETVTLILSNNIGTETIFNDTPGKPDSVLTILKSNTDQWTNVTPLTSRNTYVSKNGYTISYEGYRSRLLEPSDLYTILGQMVEENFFDTTNLFSLPLEEENLSYLFDNLTDNTGYWMANMVTENNEMAWTIQKNLLAPAFINNTKPDIFVDPNTTVKNASIGVRPVIVVEKSKLSR